MNDLARRTARSNKPTTPEEYPTQSPQPSGDYSYTLEIVMHMKESMGKLMEAVDSLKEDSREYRADLKSIGQDIHGAKVGIRWVIAVCVAFGGIVGWAITTYLSVVQSAAHK